MYPLRPPTPNSSRPLNFPLIINCAQEVGGAKQGASIELITSFVMDHCWLLIL